MLVIILSIVGGALVIFGIVLAVIVNALNDARERARRGSCISNMKQIGCAVMYYAQDNRERFPEDLQALRSKEYLTDEYVYICPSSNKEYIYIGKGLVAGNAGSDIPILIECNGFHERYVNILYADGSTLGHNLSQNFSTCTGLLKELFPNLTDTKEGRIVWENARRADSMR